ncbi:hypothetical protein GDO81_024507 [Engystomops pustulosus]|uniref:Uncharacterized protein n=1 Tax=Engystomops pustulosus TaxID=76066 RepID=A0AAV6YRF6_ENGPU|nr:hypothetical protein GDO81_024507 [Engystomops pustulosus]
MIASLRGLFLISILCSCVCSGETVRNKSFHYQEAGSEEGGGKALSHVSAQCLNERLPCNLPRFLGTECKPVMAAGLGIRLPFSVCAQELLEWWRLGGMCIFYTPFKSALTEDQKIGGSDLT